MMVLACLVASASAADETRIWVDPVEVHGAWFPDEVATIRAAIEERLRREPGVEVVDATQWEAAARGGRAQLDGPVCAAPMTPEELVERRLGIGMAGPFLDDRALTFSVRELVFQVEVETFAVDPWTRAIADSRGARTGRGGGVSGFGVTGGAFGMFVDAIGAWEEEPFTDPASTSAVTGPLTACRDESPSRRRDQSVSGQWVVDVSPDGGVRRLEEVDGAVSADSGKCIGAQLRGLRFPKGEGERRLVLWVVDRAFEPVPHQNITADLEAGESGLDAFMITDETQLQACKITEPVAFSMEVGPAGSIVSIQTEDSCVHGALERVRFPCPEGGTTTLTGRVYPR